MFYSLFIYLNIYLWFYYSLLPSFLFCLCGQKYIFTDMPNFIKTLLLLKLMYSRTLIIRPPVFPVIRKLYLKTKPVIKFCFIPKKINFKFRWMRSILKVFLLYILLFRYFFYSVSYYTLLKILFSYILYFLDYFRFYLMHTDCFTSNSKPAKLKM